MGNLTSDGWWLDKAGVMESKKFKLNPNAPVFIPSSHMFSYGKNGSDGIPSGQTSYADSHTQTGVFEGASVLPDIEQVDCEEDFSNMAWEFLESTEDPASGQATEHPPDDTFHVRSLATNFPGYSQESILDVYAANEGDMEATVDMLTQLENFAIVGNLPDTLGIGDVSTACPPDDKKPNSSSDPVSSSSH